MASTIVVGIGNGRFLWLPRTMVEELGFSGTASPAFSGLVDCH